MALTSAFESLEARRLLTAGVLDPTFGHKGLVTFQSDAPVTMGTVAATSLPDGKTLLMGTTNAGDNSVYYAFALSRLNADGSPDRSFGYEGVLPIPSDNDGPPTPRGVLPQTLYNPTCLAVDKHGRIYVASGGYGQNPGVARLLPDGSPDTSFGDHGVTGSIPIGAINAIAIGGDGSVYIGGDSSLDRRSDPAHTFTVAKLRSDGSVDTSYGDRGAAVTAFSQRGRVLDSTIHALSVSANGAVTAAGGEDGSLDLARLDYRGRLDSSFGQRGRVRLVIYRGDASHNAHINGLDDFYFNALSITDDGRIFAGAGGNDYGYGEKNPASLLAVAKFHPDGSLDTSFGDGGIVRVIPRYTTSLRATGLRPLSNGGVLVAASLFDSATGGLLLARLNSNGTPDGSFGSSLPSAPKADRIPAGWRFWTERPGTYDSPATGILGAGDGFVIPYAGAPTSSLAGSILTAVSFNADGTIHSSFGQRGIAQTPLNIPGSEFPTDILTGKVSGSPIFIDRFISNGGEGSGRSASSALTAGGSSVLSPLPGLDNPGQILAIQSNGGTYVQYPRTDTVALGRLNADGSPDRSFGKNGFVRFGGADIYAQYSVRKLLIRADGSIVVDLESDDYDEHDTIYVLDPQGNITASYQLAQNWFDMGSGSIYGDMALAPDGSVVVSTVNQTLNLGETDLHLGALRLSASDLTPDAIFGVNGQANTGVQLDPDVSYSPTLAVLPDGSIILGATEWLGVDNRNIGTRSGAALAKLTPQGQLDASFGQNGIARPTDVDSIGTGFMAVQSNGKVLLSSEDSRLVAHILRYNGDGSPDTTFGTDGHLTFQFTPRVAAEARPYLTIQRTRSGEKLLATSTFARPSSSPFNSAASYIFVANILL